MPALILTRKGLTIASPPIPIRKTNKKHPQSKSITEKSKNVFFYCNLFHPLISINNICK